MFFDSEDAIMNGVDGIAIGAVDELADPTPGRTSTVIHVDKTGRRKYQDEREYKPLCEDRAMKGYNSGMGEIFRKVCAVSPISDNALLGLLANTDTDVASSADAAQTIVSTLQKVQPILENGSLFET